MEKQLVIQGFLVLMFGFGLFLMSERRKFMKIFPKDPVDEVYESIDHAIKIGQKVLEINVNHISHDVFVAMYRGMRDQGLSLDIQRRDQQDILIVNLQEYKGPRNQKLKKRVMFDSPKKNVATSSFKSQGPRGGQRGPQSTNRRRHEPDTSFLSSITAAFKPVNKEPAKVISLDDYRRRKQVVVVSPKDVG